MTTDIEVDDGQIPETLETDVFRSVQELLNNVARHAHAAQVRVELALCGEQLSVLVMDDGDGFDSARPVGADAPVRESRGLRGLRERTERLGGRYRIESAPGQGTAVRLEWPLVAQHSPRSGAQLN